jgi:hypothetical protein
MKFLTKIDNLSEKYNNSSFKKIDEANLYGLFDSPPPLARHVVFNSIPQSVIQNIVKNYKLHFPKQLLTIYKTMNGANLFWTTFAINENLHIPMNYLSIYGVPLTYDRKHLEPFNISVEDLGRADDTPQNWLKFGSFCFPNDSVEGYDLFVNVDTEKTFAVESRTERCNIIYTWNSIDECLCDILDKLNAFLDD